ncbi:MAG: alpha-galactosidase [Phocaeicola vulgatus]
MNPKSELYEKHKDCVIHLPNRDEYYFRNQLVLDLSNPESTGLCVRSCGQFDDKIS